jgi:hypothetical protein
MVGGWRAPYVATLCVGALGVASSLASCGGGSAAKSDGGKRCLSSCDAGDAGDTGAPAEGGTTCAASSDAGEPRVPPGHIAFDGGVPLDKIAYAFAVARCNYWGRCLSFAPYVVSDCIAALTNGNSWSVGSCGGSAPSFGCWDAIITITSGTPLQAVEAGVVKYDPQQESACIEALQTEGCTQWDFPATLPPACSAAFTCASDAGTGDAGSSDGAATDGGGGCPWHGFGQQVPCSTDTDCTGAVAPAGPYCVDGYCFPKPCGSVDLVDCTDFVGSGQACDSDSPGFGGALFVDKPTSLCSLGLTCKGLVIGTGDLPTTLGVCATAQDIGGPCVQGASVTGCMKGLVCPCGTCQLPPSQGPCVADSCRADVAYCDFPSATCKPVKQRGDACTGIGNQCATDLHCDSTTSTCQAGQP